MSTYKVKSNLKHNGEDYKKGDTIDIDGEAADVLLRDNIIVDADATDEDEDEVIQPPVNKVSREGDDVDGKKKVEPGTTEKPQPGDAKDEDENKNNDAPKSKYKILKGLEYPQGTVHEIDAILELTDEEASHFAEGLIEKVEDNL